MAYATYEFYAKTYAGSMSELDFVKYSGKAGAYIDMMTNGRAAAAPDSMARNLALAFCHIIDNLKQEDDSTTATQGGTIQSANNDGLSVTYATSQKVTFANRRYQTLLAWLTAPVNLMSGWI